MSRSNQTKEKHANKIVIVIVEGSSDKNLLESPLSELYEKKYGPGTQVCFSMIKEDDKFPGGDITSKYGAKPEKMEMLINQRHP